ncbi:MAG TPA: MTH1187 family thiamine-binding protein [Propionibacteriaceae bacterium]|nr:MTH1187 family thiamine-binding protein [Propionibacteriaceae bacterium]
MLVAFSVAPGSSDPDGSVSAAVADAIKIIRDSGLPNETNAMFTNVEGDWDEVMGLVKRTVDAVLRHSDRVSLVLKADIRPGHTNQLTAKVARVNDLLEG